MLDFLPLLLSENIAYSKFQTIGIFHPQCTSSSYEDIIRDWKLAAKHCKKYGEVS